MDRTTLKRLSRVDRLKLKNTSHIAGQLERQWSMKISQCIENHFDPMLEALTKTGKVIPPDLDNLYCEHFFDVSIRSIKYAMSTVEEHTKLGKVPPLKIPVSLKKLMQLYDLYRKGKFKPKRPIAEAKQVKTEYLKKVRSVWEKRSEDFRKGDVATQELVVKQIRKQASTTTARASTIVRTETTSYFNQARKNFYDESDYITHYLFIAIRDAATSPWCTPLTTNGKRGRSGLVYAKSDPLCNAECPATHYNCRSEYLPLNRLNPSHLKFIQDESIQRRNHQCFPLLKGWVGGSKK